MSEILDQEVNPVFEKSAPRADHYKSMTWKIFLDLKTWAETLANEVGYPVYLVGSVLWKEIPRDIDISIIIPLAEYIEQYGTLPKVQKEYSKYLYNVHMKNCKPYCDCLNHMIKNDFINIDLKFCPDSWFTDRPKLLLAAPLSARKVNLTKCRNLNANNECYINNHVCPKNLKSCRWYAPSVAYAKEIIL